MMGWITSYRVDHAGGLFKSRFCPLLSMLQFVLTDTSLLSLQNTDLSVRVVDGVSKLQQKSWTQSYLGFSEATASCPWVCWEGFSSLAHLCETNTLSDHIWSPDHLFQISAATVPLYDFDVISHQPLLVQEVDGGWGPVIQDRDVRAVVHPAVDPWLRVCSWRSNRRREQIPFLYWPCESRWNKILHF